MSSQLGIDFMLVINRQGKTRMSRWYSTYSLTERTSLIKEINNLVLTRSPRSPSVFDYRDLKIIYRRYASLYFIFARSIGDNGDDGGLNDLLLLEWIHRFVETLNSYFGNVCELDLIFNYAKSFAIWDEMVVGGSLVETSTRLVVNNMIAIDDRVKRESKKY
jgi:AP-1 complex subunit sigma 1/2